jgi:addiction module RelE/StbE family toxin
MNYRLVQTDSFEADVVSIIGYLIENLKSHQAAFTLLDELEKSYLLLKNMPSSGSPVLDPLLADRGYRKFLVNNYLIVYMVDEIKNIVTLMRFFHGSQNYTKYL